MRISEIARAFGGRIVTDEAGTAPSELCEVAGAVVDSRNVSAGGIFVAVAGEHTDGHNYINRAFDKGAACVICERIPGDVTTSAERPCIVTDDSLEALRRLAAYYRTTLSCRVIGIVGSVGKTSTKELVASVLSARFRTSRTAGNFNNGIGVPLTILSIPADAEMAVVEMGISDFGEMDVLGSIARPDAVVMTNIGPCHLEKLGDPAGVLRAKSEVFRHIRKGGAVFYNAADTLLSSLKVDGCDMLGFTSEADACGASSGATDACGASSGATDACGATSGAGDACGSGLIAAYAEDIEYNGLEGSHFTVKLGGSMRADGSEYEGCTVQASVRLPGKHMVTNAVAASLVGRYYGMEPGEIAEGLAAAQPVSGRSNLIRTDSLLIVDDCYNANPRSMRSAIDLMKDASGRRIAILGDMFELGDDAEALHRSVGEYAAQAGFDIVCFAGTLARCMYEGATCVSGLTETSCEGATDSLGPRETSCGGAMCASERIGASYRWFEGTDGLLAGLGSIGLRKGDTVLVKASHGMSFTAVTAALKDMRL